MTYGLRLRLEALTKKGVFFFGAALILSFLLFVTIGVFGPTVSEVQAFTGNGCPDGQKTYDSNICHGTNPKETKWQGEIHDLDKLNQFFVFTGAIANTLHGEAGITKSVEVQISLEAKNNKDSHWNTLLDKTEHTRDLVCHQYSEHCEELSLLTEPFICYNSYRVNVTFLNFQEPGLIRDIEFKFTYVNSHFTLFELVIKSAFFLMTLEAIVLFVRARKSYLGGSWMPEHKWVVMLLVGLMLFNDPLYLIDVLLNHWFLPYLYALFQITFLAMLLLVWLLVLDSMVKMHEDDDSELSYGSFYLPKCGFIFIIWLSATTMVTYVRVHQLEDPSFQVPEDIPNLKIYNHFVTTLLAILSLWLFYLGARVIQISGSPPCELSRRLRFFSCISCCVFVAVWVGYGLGVIRLHAHPREEGHWHHNSAEFLCFTALFNLYCFAVAYAFMPCKDSNEEEIERLLGVSALPKSHRHMSKQSAYAPLSTRSKY